MSETRDHDDSRDAHLLAALRHAPDRDALPPREVSERILAAARAAVRPAPWWTRVGAWLTQPQAAAAFGTLAVASLVGILWSTREPPAVEPALPEAMRERSVPSAAAEQPSSPVGLTAGSAASSEPARDLLAQTTPPPTPAPKQEAAPRRSQEAKAHAESRQRDQVVTDKAAAPTAKAAAPSAEVAAAAPQAADAPAAEQRSNNTTVSPSLARRDAASSGAASTDAPTAGASSLAPRANIAPNPLAQADVSLATGQGSWSSNGRALPHAAAQTAWWAQFQRETAAAWARVPPASERTSPPWLMLTAGGKGIASIDLAADSVVFCAADQTACWRAPITPAQREAWTAEIARW
jgi:hypothetical protein